jgi:HEAT repeat protein
LEAILHHEFAHIKRKDTLVQFFAQIACCLYWMNPLTWILERRLFIERERACDDIAMGKRIKASEYAGHLMEVMEEAGTRQKLAWVTSAMAEGTDFKDRILSVLDPLAKRTTPNLGQSTAVVALAACILLPLAALHPWSEAGAEVQLHVFPAHAISSEPRGGSFVGNLNDEQKMKPEDVADDGTRALIAVLQSEDANMREHAATALAKQGAKGAVPALMAVVCQDPDPDVREHAASALAVLGDTRATPALIDALKDNDASVREHVASALGKLKDTRAISPLMNILRSDSNARVREHAASALGRIGGDEVSGALTQSYHQDGDIRVRAHAAYGLGLARDPGAFDLLIDGLISKHAIIRSHCAEALGLIGDPRAVEHLQATLHDSDSSVRQSAQRALDKMIW